MICSFQTSNSMRKSLGLFWEHHGWANSCQLCRQRDRERGSGTVCKLLLLKTKLIFIQLQHPPKRQTMELQERERERSGELERKTHKERQREKEKPNPGRCKFVWSFSEINKSAAICPRSVCQTSNQNIIHLRHRKHHYADWLLNVRFKHWLQVWLLCGKQTDLNVRSDWWFSSIDWLWYGFLVVQAVHERTSALLQPYTCTLQLDSIKQTSITSSQDGCPVTDRSSIL